MHDRITIPGFTAIARHSWTNIVIGKIVPLVLFLSALKPFGVDAAVLAALIWSLLVVAYQHRAGQRIAGLVIMSVIGNMTKAMFALATGSMFFYFAQPTVSTFVVGLAFLGSIALGQPLAGRLIEDFCPFDDATANHPEFDRFAFSASLLWAVSSLLNGGVTVYLLATQPLPQFLVMKALLGPTMTAITLVIGIAWFRRQMGRAGIEVVLARRVSAPSPA